MKLSEKYKSPKVAILFRDYFMTLWLCVFGWRLRNMIECRIGTDALRANVFNGPIMRGIAVPTWADPNKDHWQYRFASAENKGGHEPAGFVPRILIPFLEPYLEFRKTLIGDRKSDILFLTIHGEQFTRRAFEAWLASRSIKYVSKHLTPHAARRALPAKLAAAGNSLLEISRVLWQVDLKTTAEYLDSFDASDGAICLDELFGDPNVKLGHDLKLDETKEPDQPKRAAGEEGAKSNGPGGIDDEDSLKAS